VWAAVWQPWGGHHSITGPASLDARLPGQWFQSETGLHYNWHRSYDPTVGRYTQPDPLGFVDGPSVYGYAVGLPMSGVDPDGRAVNIPIQVAMAYCRVNPAACAAAAASTAEAVKQIIVCMASPGNQADSGIAKDWEQSVPRNPDKCAWLEANKDKYPYDRWKRTMKAWGCRPSRMSSNR
jgi:RHS repeat-associated protein